MQLVFFLPQLVQLLRGDTDGAIRRFFLTAASHSDLFAHQLIWALNSEAKPPEEAFNPEVKRWVQAGWQAGTAECMYSSHVSLHCISVKWFDVISSSWYGKHATWHEMTECTD